MNEITNNKVNLCDSCSQTYPGCTSKPENVYFGDGAGHDNICACPEYRPSVQPQSTMGQVNEAVQSTNDCISRQAAIDALDVLCQEHRYKIPGKSETYSEYNEAWQDALDRAEGLIFNLPSAQPERIKGRWIRYPKICKVECDQCGKRFRTNFTPRNFCPSCGADMRGDEDEKTEHI